MSRYATLFLVAIVCLAGCSGVTTSPAPGTAPDLTTTERTTTTTDDDPEKGANLLSVTRLNTSEATAFPSDERATYGNLTDDQQALFDEARRCDCAVEQTTFRFNDDDRLKVVRYEGEWYYLRVAIV